MVKTLFWPEGFYDDLCLQGILTLVYIYSIRLSWRPPLLGWRPSLVGWRPFLALFLAKAVDAPSSAAL